MTYSNYLKTKDILRNTTAIIRNGQHYRLLNGELITEQQFREMYQLPTVLNGCYANPDKTKMYLI